MKAAVVFLVFTLFSCASELTPEGRNARVTAALSPEEAKSYTPIGVVVASETFQHEGDEKDCRNQLQNRAGRYGADLLLILKTERHPCVIGQVTECVEMTGRAYRKN